VQRQLWIFFRGQDTRFEVGAHVQTVVMRSSSNYTGWPRK